MPCDTIQTCEVDLKVADTELLEEALKAMGARTARTIDGGGMFFYDGSRFSIEAGRIICPVGREYVADLVKQAYARAAVGKAAKRFGWSVKADTKQKLKLTRRF